MKRSEMIKLIQDAVYEKFQIKVRKKDVDPILTKIEQAGMLPPKIVKCTNDDWLETGIMYSEVVNEWEPEND